MDIKTLCLGVLCLQDATGYEIRRVFEQAFSYFHGAGYGSIYPALDKLTAEGLVTCHLERQDKRPDRKLFQVTEAGRKAFRRALAESAPDEKLRSDFLVQMFFAHLLETEDLARLLDRFEQELGHKLDYLNSLILRQDLTPGMRFGLEYGLATITAKLDVIRRHRRALLRDHRSIDEELPDVRA
jgi:DNA-binding PadR family transcriptional regulator